MGCGFVANLQGGDDSFGVVAEVQVGPWRSGDQYQLAAHATGGEPLVGVCRLFQWQAIRDPNK